MKNKKSISVLCAVLFLMACARDANQDFQHLKHNFEKQRSLYFSSSSAKPSLQILDSARVDLIKQFVKKYQDSLSDIPSAKLTAQAQKDYSNLNDFLTSAAQVFNQEQHYRWDPSFYNVYPHFENILNQSSLPFPDKLSAIEKLMQVLPDHYAMAIQNIKEVSIRKIAPAKDDLFKIYHLLKYDIIKQASQAGVSTAALTEALPNWSSAIFSIKDYLAFCKSMEFEYGEGQSQIVFRDSLTAG